MLNNYANNTKEFDSIVQLMIFQDSTNFLSLIHQIKKYGYPGGYRMMPVGPGLVFLHAKKEWLQNYYSVFMNEIEAGRISHHDFSKGIDRMFTLEHQQKPYNSYIPDSEAKVVKIGSPELIFINRCSIGMSPYYDIYIPRYYPRGTTPPKSALFDYYKRNKQNFNCTSIR